MTIFSQIMQAVDGPWDMIVALALIFAGSIGVLVGLAVLAFAIMIVFAWLD